MLLVPEWTLACVGKVQFQDQNSNREASLLNYFWSHFGRYEPLAGHNTQHCSWGWQGLYPHLPGRVRSGKVVSSVMMVVARVLSHKIYISTILIGNRVRIKVYRMESRSK